MVATHKKYEMPNDDIYLPIQVGSFKKEDFGYCRDDQGDNISSKNPFFCELTGLYWGWKNLNYDYLGLVHYRRYFTLSNKIHIPLSKRMPSVLSTEEVEKLLQKSDIILPKPRRYFIESLYSHYKHTMYVEPLDETRNILIKKYPNYVKEFDKLKHRTTGHMFNMFIMKREYLEQYCQWLFDILFDLEKKFKNVQYSSFHSRFYGRISELLLDVYIRTNHLKYTEVRVIDIEKINWFHKINSFLKAKFLGKKYEKSF